MKSIYILHIVICFVLILFLSSRTLADGQHVFVIRVGTVVVVRRFVPSPPVLRLAYVSYAMSFLGGVNGSLSRYPS